MHCLISATMDPCCGRAMAAGRKWSNRIAGRRDLVTRYRLVLDCCCSCSERDVINYFRVATACSAVHWSVTADVRPRVHAHWWVIVSDVCVCVCLYVCLYRYPSRSLLLRDTRLLRSLFGLDVVLSVAFFHCKQFLLRTNRPGVFPIRRKSPQGGISGLQEEIWTTDWQTQTVEILNF